MDVKRLLVTTFICMLLSACSSNSTQNELSEEGKKANIFYTYGTQALQEKRYTEALDNLLKAQEITPNDSKIHNNLGMAYYFKNGHEKAIFHLQKSLELDPKNSDAKNNLASVYLNNGQIQLADKLYQEISEDLIYPTQYRIKYNRAIIALKRNQVEKAIGLLNSAVQEYDEYCSAHYLLGEIEFQRQFFEKASLHFRNASYGVCASLSAPVYYEALSLQNMGDIEHAKEKYREIIQRFPKDPNLENAKKQLLKLENEESRSSSNPTATNNLYNNPTF